MFNGANIQNYILENFIFHAYIYFEYMVTNTKTHMYVCKQNSTARQHIQTLLLYYYIVMLGSAVLNFHKKFIFMQGMSMKCVKVICTIYKVCACAVCCFDIITFLCKFDSETYFIDIFQYQI